MPDYLALRGTFHVAGFSPDGDSIRFAATTPALWDDPRFTWSTPAKRAAAKKQLRLEAIDALETHYEGCHQPRAFGFGALEFLLGALGITEVRYNLLLNEIVAARDGVPGTICARQLDGNDRPIAFAYAGHALFADGARLRGEDLQLRKSANFLMAEAGLAYATFYETFEPATMDVFRRTIAAARRARRGLWALDRTSGFEFLAPDTIQENVVILPKLFRRLVTFSLGHASIDELPDYLRRMTDRVQLIGAPALRRLSELMTISGRRVSLAVRPEDLIFEPRTLP